MNFRADNSNNDEHNWVELAVLANDITDGSEDSTFKVGTWGGGTEYGNTLVAASGKVGIGTSPGYPLDVASTATTSIAYQRTGVSAKKWGFDSDNSATYLINLTDNVRAITAYNAGNIGIGTISPSTKLTVKNDSNNTSFGDNNIITIQNASTTDNSRMGLAFTGNTSIGSGLAVIDAVSYDQSHGKTSLNFSVYDGSWHNDMMVLKEGKVGIGETGPAYPLHVDGANVSSGGGLANLCLVDRTAYNGTLPGAGITFRGEYTSGGNTTNFATIQGIKENTSSGNYATALRFTTRANGGNLTERLRIASNGHVSIQGTANASADGLSKMTIGSGSGDSGLSIYSGTTSTSRIMFADGTSGGAQYDGFIAYEHNPQKLGLGVAGTGGYKMVIDSLGDVLIGQTSQTGYAFAQKLVVGDGNGNDGITIQSGSTHQGNLAFNHSSATTAYGRISYQHNTNYMSFFVNNDEKVRINTNGTMYVTPDLGAHTNGTSFAHSTYGHAAVFGTNSTPNGSVVIEDYDVSSGIGNTVLNLYLRDQDPASYAVFCEFTDGGGRVGSITHNDDGGGVTYNTTSDYRLKENVNYTWDALPLINQLKPAKFNFIGKSDKTRQGFLAHEVSDIIPGSVKGDKDQMEPIGTIRDDNSGNIVYEGVFEHFCKEGQTWTQTGTKAEYQQLDYSRLVPLLTKAVQEQQAIIDNLKSRIETLEG